MRSCKEVAKLISISQEEKLTFGQRAELKFHLFMCKHCKHFSKNVNTLRSALRGFSSGEHEDKN